MTIDPFFDQYRNNPKWKALAEALVGEEAEGFEPEWFNKPPGAAHPTPPHQDNFYFCLEPCHVVTLWLALDPVNEENGCLRYVPGSHLEGIRPHKPTSILGFSQGVADYGDADQQREQAIFLQPNDLVAHHGATIHRAEPNHTKDRHRRAFAIVFRGLSCKRNEEAFARYEQAMREQHRQMGLLNLGE
jgi:phytanoyl-CoA hydroxylase